jgi:CHAD domain-containing protein
VFGIVTPSTLFHTQLEALARCFPAVFEGDPSGIHNARIATRRIRELLPLIAHERRSGHPNSDLENCFKRMGRSFGRVRDTDVRVALLASLERRIPHAAPTLVIVRQQRERERLKRVRKLIKRLERLEAPRIVASLVYRRAPLRAAMFGARGPWRRDLRTLMVARARATGEAIERATGIYFPNRTHATRIAIKRLRYAMEIANEIGHADLTAPIRDLKKSQDILGELHDREDLNVHLEAEASAATATENVDIPHVGLVRQVLEAEIRHLHGRYLDRRETLRVIAHAAAEESVASTTRSASVLALGALAVSSSVYVANRARWPHARH